MATRSLLDERRERRVKAARGCAKCGALWPEMFNVPGPEWKHYVEPQMQDKMLCEACYTQIKAWIDGFASPYSKRSHD
jgi:hypothetical protein